MFAFLKRRKEKDPRNIEQLIYDIAEHQRDADFHLFYKLMVGRQVFVAINRASLPTSVEPEVPYTTQASDRLEMKTEPWSMVFSRYSRLAPFACRFLCWNAMVRVPKDDAESSRTSRRRTSRQKLDLIKGARLTLILL